MIINTSERRPVRTTARGIKRQIKTLLVLSAPVLFALLLASSFTAGTAMATPPSGVSQTPIASGVLPEPIRMKFAQRNPHAPGDHSGPVALSQNGATINTAQSEEGFGNGLDVSNVAIVKNIIQPGGYFGWHQHSGPSWIVVTQGTLTFYNGDDPDCTGSAYFDPGDHTHNARNETNQVVENYVVRMLPAGGAPRIDMPDPGVCPGLP
jgi:quercetin dioxygenase-like cupin family protein